MSSDRLTLVGLAVTAICANLLRISVEPVEVRPSIWFVGAGNSIAFAPPPESGSVGSSHFPAEIVTLDRIRWRSSGVALAGPYSAINNYGLQSTVDCIDLCPESPWFALFLVSNETTFAEVIDATNQIRRLCDVEVTVQWGEVERGFSAKIDTGVAANPDSCQPFSPMKP